MVSKKKIAPPAPLSGSNPTRVNEVVPTVGEYNTTQGDDVRVSKTRSDWREREFTRVLRQHGKFVWWRKALLCPCATLETDQAELDCADCGGSGYVYVQPQQIQIHMAQFDKKTSIFDKIGLWQSGTVTVTAEAKYRMGYRDSYEMRDDVFPMNEILEKNNRRGRRRVLPASVDSARFRIMSIASVLFKTSAGLVSLERDIHYTITPEGWIQWTPTGNRLVPSGARFSVHYDYHPIFLVDSWMHITRIDTSGRASTPGTPRVVAHPVQCMAKLDFLVDVNGVPSLEPIAQATGFGPKEPDA